MTSRVMTLQPDCCPKRKLSRCSFDEVLTVLEVSVLSPGSIGACDTHI